MHKDLFVCLDDDGRVCLGSTEAAAGSWLLDKPRTSIIPVERHHWTSFRDTSTTNAAEPVCGDDLDAWIIVTKCYLPDYGFKTPSGTLLLTQDTKVNDEVV